jgi:hypothetical protein
MKSINAARSLESIELLASKWPELVSGLSLQQKLLQNGHRIE